MSAKLFVRGSALILILLAGCAVAPRHGTPTSPASTPAPPPTSPPLPAPTSLEALDGPLVQLAWFYKPPRDRDLDSLRQHFDVFILTKTDEPTRDALRARGVAAPFLLYLTFQGIHNPGACDAQPRHNQVADQIGDYCALSTQHPDWFLLDANGHPIILEGNYVAMDPGHPGWRAFFLERARQSQEQLGWDGVFLDNVWASLETRVNPDARPAAYPDDASYQAAVAGFLDYLYTGYFHPRARPLLANISLRDDAVWFRYLQHLDGAMVERFAVGWQPGEYLDAVTWEDQLTQMEQAQALGKQLILVAQGAQTDNKRQTFAYASYLLISAGRASFRYTYSDNYNEAWLYSNYGLDLGEPLGPRYQDGQIWRRDFTRGSVWVDPVAHTAAIQSP